MGIDELLLVRHGESEGNRASATASAAGAELIDITEPDARVRLSELGREQAAGVGVYLAALPPAQLPRQVWSSSYLRAVQTAELALSAARLEIPVRRDERLRDRELGVLDRLTTAGVAARFPDEQARRRHLGRFYYRPPGGESWADVALRLRSFVRDVLDGAGSGPTLITSHDAVIVLFRYVLEGLTEDGLMEVVKHGNVRNASVTRLVRGEHDLWSAAEFDSVEHLSETGKPTTRHDGEVQ